MFIIQLDITDSESNIEIIKKLKDIFSFMSKLKSETWVIGNNIKSPQTKKTIDSILEKENYGDKIKIFLIEYMVYFS
jgi:hypothetical protein